jgi:hypothetical protein
LDGWPGDEVAGWEAVEDMDFGDSADAVGGPGEVDDGVQGGGGLTVNGVSGEAGEGT